MLIIYSRCCFVQALWRWCSLQFSMWGIKHDDVPLCEYHIRGLHIRECSLIMMVKLNLMHLNVITCNLNLFFWHVEISRGCGTLQTQDADGFQFDQWPGWRKSSLDRTEQRVRCSDKETRRWVFPIQQQFTQTTNLCQTSHFEKMSESLKGLIVFLRATVCDNSI